MDSREPLQTQELIDIISINDSLIEKETGYKKISEAMKGLPKSEEAKTKMSISAKARSNFQSGLKRSEETKQLISAARQKLPAERRKQISSLGGKTHKDKPKKKYECPHCKQMIAANMFNRYHNDNCKLNTKKENI